MKSKSRETVFSFTLTVQWEARGGGKTKIPAYCLFSTEAIVKLMAIELIQVFDLNEVSWQNYPNDAI